MGCCGSTVNAAGSCPGSGLLAAVAPWDNGTVLRGRQEPRGVRQKAQRELPIAPLGGIAVRIRRGPWWAPPPDDLSRSLALQGMPPTFFGFVWRVSAWSQVWISLLAVVVFVLNTAPLEMQRRILNAAVLDGNVEAGGGAGRRLWLHRAVRRPRQAADEHLSGLGRGEGGARAAPGGQRARRCDAGAARHGRASRAWRYR